MPAVNGHATALGLARFWWLALDGHLATQLWVVTVGKFEETAS